LKSTTEERPRALTWLKSQTNINPSNPFIFIHNRDDAFLPKLGHHSYRDFAPDVFNLIIEKYCSKYNFIRGGRVAVKPISSRQKGCIDLPFIPHSDIMDILSHECSQFFFGSDSGISCVSAMFRKPIAGICYPPTSYGFLRTVNLYSLGLIPKRIQHEGTNETIGLIEMYERKWINFWETRQFNEAKIQVVDNSEEEVFEFFTEVLNMYYKDCDKLPIQTPEQEEFWRIVTHYEPHSRGEKLILDNCFIGAGFLKRNAYLIAS
jgi:putative glycosyltransferase (TIGR04372 family)